MAAERFGHYQLDELIGRGGMGEVYRAFDTVKQRAVALKRLPAALAADADFQARFRKESALAARLSEPHIIPIHDYGEIDGRLFIDMRLVAGRDLATLLDEYGPLPPARAVGIVSQLARALDAAHYERLIHRDVKPSNVLISGSEGDEFAYLIDFGISQAVTGTATTSVTATGTTTGTLDYMAPERFAPGRTDRRVDVYSLACLLFETLTGTKPFDGDGLPAMLHAHLNVEPPRPSACMPRVPAAMDAVIARGMAKDPEQRYPSAGALAAGARAALDAPTPQPTSNTADRNTALGDTRLAATDVGGDQPLGRHSTEERTLDRRRRVRIALVLVAAIAVGGGALLWTTSSGTGLTSTSPAPRANPRATGTIQVGREPHGLAVSADGSRLYTADTSSDTMSVIDTGSNAVIATVQLGDFPHRIVLSPDGRRAYAANGSSGTVSVVDTASRAVTATIRVGDDFLNEVKISPDGRRVYAVVSDANSLTVIDTGSNAVSSTIPVEDPVDVAISPDGRRGYATSHHASAVSVIDTTSRAVSAAIPVGQYPLSVAITPDGRRAYVTNLGADTVSVIDTASNTLAATVGVGASPTGLAISPDGRTAYVANRDVNTVSVIDTASNTVTATVPVGIGPEGMAVSPDGRHLYVANGRANTISVIDTS